MEKLESFVSINKFSKTLEYYNKAKEYIDKSVSELLKSVSRSKDETVKSKGLEEKNEDGEMIADKKYTEGLILYAQGKYYEAERAWELTLRLNPRHQKAKVALRKLKMNHNNAGE
jgi:tetratricopeptide (TPR) repeat protein